MKFRHEYKHPINQSDVICLRQRLDGVMKRDAHSDDAGGYWVRSLYFDNVWDHALRQKIDGVNHREKFRIRYYNSDTSFLRLEKKSKHNGLCQKESVAITREMCEQLLLGNVDILRHSKEELIQELYAKMRYQLLRPKCVVVYRRESFVFGPGNVRITIDTKLSGSNSPDDFLNPQKLLFPGFSPPVLEVKWDEYLPEIIRTAVQLKTRRSTEFSKYAAIRR